MYPIITLVTEVLHYNTGVMRAAKQWIVIGVTYEARLFISAVNKHIKNRFHLVIPLVRNIANPFWKLIPALLFFTESSDAGCKIPFSVVVSSVRASMHIIKALLSSQYLRGLCYSFIYWPRKRLDEKIGWLHQRGSVFPNRASRGRRSKQVTWLILANQNKALQNLNDLTAITSKPVWSPPKRYK